MNFCVKELSLLDTQCIQPSVLLVVSVFILVSAVVPSSFLQLFVLWVTLMDWIKVLARNFQKITNYEIHLKRAGVYNVLNAEVIIITKMRKLVCVDQCVIMYSKKIILSKRRIWKYFVINKLFFYSNSFQLFVRIQEYSLYTQSNTSLHKTLHLSIQ